MLKHVESVVLFVHDVVAAAKWYADIFSVEVQFENPHFAFVRGPDVVVGFHPADEKCPGGIGGTSVYWEVEDLNEAVAYLTARGARLYRGPARTDFGAAVALMVDPFGCTVGLNQSTEESRRSVSTQLPQAGT
jgi:predicted enzyme related to lactoylglutathione lyase